MGVHWTIIDAWKLRQTLFPVLRVLLVLDLCVYEQLIYMLPELVNLVISCVGYHDISVLSLWTSCPQT